MDVINKNRVQATHIFYNCLITNQSHFNKIQH